MNEPQYNPKLTGIQNFKIAFEKGKLEQKKEELELKRELLYIYENILFGQRDWNNTHINRRVREIKISLPKNDLKEVCSICRGTGIDKRTYPSTECECMEEKRNGR